MIETVLQVAKRKGGPPRGKKDGVYPFTQGERKVKDRPNMKIHSEGRWISRKAFWPNRGFAYFDLGQALQERFRPNNSGGVRQRVAWSPWCFSKRDGKVWRGRRATGRKKSKG